MKTKKFRIPRKTKKRLKKLEGLSDWLIKTFMPYMENSIIGANLLAEEFKKLSEINSKPNLNINPPAFYNHKIYH